MSTYTQFFGSNSIRYFENIGNNLNTSFVVTHNLNDSNLLATVKENSSGYVVYPDIKFVTNNTISVEFIDAPSTNQYNITVVKVGV